MALELLLLCALIFIFIVSFCGLLQKIKQSYERERLIADRIARRQDIEGVRQNSRDSFSEVYVNSAYIAEARNSDSSGIFPAAPPPYTQNIVDPPPKYEDVIKSNTIEVPETVTSTIQEAPRPTSQPPPYTIST